MITLLIIIAVLLAIIAFGPAIIELIVGLGVWVVCGALLVLAVSVGWVFINNITWELVQAAVLILVFIAVIGGVVELVFRLPQGWKRNCAFVVVCILAFFSSLPFLI